MKKSEFIGKLELKTDIKNGKNYLEGYFYRLPIHGWERREIKNSFILNINFGLLLETHTHGPKGSNEKDVIPKIEIKQSVIWGSVKYKIANKTGNRYLKGTLGGIPVLGWEDKKIKNKFHLVIDDSKRDYLRNKNSKDVGRVEIENKNTVKVAS